MAKEEVKEVETETTTEEVVEEKPKTTKKAKVETTEVLGGGEVSPEKDAEVQARNIEDARQDALRNHNESV